MMTSSSSTSLSSQQPLLLHPVTHSASEPLSHPLSLSMLQSPSQSRSQSMSSQPQSILSSSIAYNDSVTLRLTGGDSVVHCKGRCVRGPRFCSLVCTSFILIATLALFFGGVAEQIWSNGLNGSGNGDHFDLLSGRIVVISIAVLSMFSIIYLFLTGLTDPGILPRGHALRFLSSDIDGGIISEAGGTSSKDSVLRRAYRDAALGQSSDTPYNRPNSPQLSLPKSVANESMNQRNQQVDYSSSVVYNLIKDETRPQGGNIDFPEGSGRLRSSTTSSLVAAIAVCHGDTNEMDDTNDLFTIESMPDSNDMTSMTIDDPGDDSKISIKPSPSSDSINEYGNSLLSSSEADRFTLTNHDTRDCNSKRLTTSYSLIDGSSERVRYLEVKCKDGTTSMVTIKACVTCSVWRPPRSAHCPICNNCVEGFDHHCPFVSNCIGKRNYRFFLGFVWITALLSMLIFCICIVFLVGRSISDGIENQNSGDGIITFLKASPSALIVSLTCLVGGGFVVALASFHVYAFYTNQTTNEIIKRRYRQHNPFYESYVGTCKAVCFPSPLTLPLPLTVR